MQSARVPSIRADAWWLFSDLESLRSRLGMQLEMSAGRAGAVTNALADAVSALEKSPTVDNLIIKTTHDVDKNGTLKSQLRSTYMVLYLGYSWALRRHRCCIHMPHTYMCT